MTGNDGAPQMRSAEAVPRVADLTRAEFIDSYSRLARPVVVSRGLSAWGPPSKWNPDYLVAELGDKPVQVAIASNGVFHYDPLATRTFQLEKLTFRQAAAAIAAPPENKGVYLMQQSIGQSFPELSGDVRVPDLLGDEPAAPHLWFGSANNVTPLHYDPLDNFFLQLHGRKRFTLFSPAHFEELYPFPVEARLSHISHVDVERPDLARHPRVAEVPRFEVTLDPGDMLFLPVFWWHHVRSLEVSISLNFWSAPALAHCLVPAGLRLLSSGYERDRLASMGAPFRGGRGAFLRAAREVSTLGKRWPAVMLAGAAVEQPLRTLCRENRIAEQDANGPRPLAVINQELAAAGVYSAGQAETIGALDRAFERARQRNDELFTDEDVAAVLSTVEALLA